MAGLVKLQVVRTKNKGCFCGDISSVEGPERSPAALIFIGLACFIPHTSLSSTLTPPDSLRRCLGKNVNTHGKR